MTRTFRYPARGLYADYARSVAGIACTLGPLLFMQPAGAVIWALGAGAALFLVYFTRTVFSHFSCIELGENGVRAGAPVGAIIRWEDLRSVRLNYYTTRSDRSGGWMQLDLHGMQRRIGIDSRLEGFAELAKVVAEKAQHRGVVFDAATRANLAALGIVDATADPE
jgi:hypothetical protein